jgi:hypothetical protein
MADRLMNNFEKRRKSVEDWNRALDDGSVHTHRIGQSHRESDFSSAVAAAAKRLADSPPRLAWRTGS